MAAYKKDLILSIGPIQTTVNLHTVQSSSGPSRKIICPDHLVPLSQQYVCKEDDNHRTFSWGECAYGIETPEGFRVLMDEDKPQLELTNELALIPVPAQEIRDNTFEGDSMYYCQPSSKASALTWTILNRQLKTGKVAFMTRGCLRRNSKEKLWKLEPWLPCPSGDRLPGQPQARARRRSRRGRDRRQADTEACQRVHRRINVHLG